MIAADRQRLRVRQRQLEFACEFVHPHVGNVVVPGEKTRGKSALQQYVAVLTFPRFSLPAPVLNAPASG
jgi:hypothetical protein